jgi:hypothetical protein
MTDETTKTDAEALRDYTRKLFATNESERRVEIRTDRPRTAEETRALLGFFHHDDTND